MSLRIGGYAAILGGLLWLVILAGNAINNGAEPGVPFLGILLVVATLATLVALIGLSAFASRRDPVLAWLAFAIPAAGAVVSLLGFAAVIAVGDTDRPIVAGLSAWAISVIGVMSLVVGSALFALATWRAGSLSRRAAALLGVGALLVVPALAGVLGGAFPPAIATIVLISAIVAFPAGWIALGLSAVRLDRPAMPSVGGPA